MKDIKHAVAQVEPYDLPLSVARGSRCADAKAGSLYCFGLSDRRDIDRISLVF